MPWLAVGLGFFVLITVVRIAVSLWTDFLWFEDLGYAETWGRILSAKLTLAFAATALVFAATSVNLLVAERLAPTDAIFARKDPLLFVRAFTAMHPNVTRNALSAVTALLVGPVAANSWHAWTLFEHGNKGPRPTYALFGKSLGFYLFRLPFLRVLTGWGFGAALLIFVVTAGSMYLNGALRASENGVVITIQARRHLSGLLAAVFLVRAAGFWYARFALTFAHHQHFDGANYVDLNVRSPAYLTMFVASLLCFFLLIFNVVRASWQIPVAVVIGWILLGLVTLVIAPLIWQRVALSNEVVKERASITRTIAATRAAFELDHIDPTDLAVDDRLVGNTGELSSSAATLRNIRLWDVGPDVAPAAFNNLQKTFQNFQITQVDADREKTASGVSARLIAVREMDANGQNPSWVNRRLTTTHGYGIVTATPGINADGEPDFVAKNLPPVGTPILSQPRIYFGEETGSYVVVDTKTKELDFGGTTNRAAPTYAGKGGIAAGSFVRRLAFALRFGDLNLLLSNSVTEQSRILWTRTIRDRAQRIAPFLRFDSDALPVVYEGRVMWVLEGYTVSSSYPNSDRTVGLDAARGGLGGSVAYARNSVRVIIDSYTGETRFFRNATEDPIVAAYDSAFPSLFDSLSLNERFPGLREMVRYPRDLFNVRSMLWGRYHTDKPDVFYNDSDRWVVGASAAGIRTESNLANAAAAAAAAGPVAPTNGTVTPTPPEYVVSDPSGTGSQEFLIQQVLVNRQLRPEQQRLRSIVIARSGSTNYGQLTVLNAPGQNFDSPSSVSADLTSTPEISDRETNLGRGGSEVISGQVQLVRVGRALLYVRPLYVRSDQTKKPTLRFVEIRYRGRTGFAPTLAEALTQVVDDPNQVPSLGAATRTGERVATPTTAPGSAATVPQLLAKASKAYVDAQTSLAKGDLGTYQSKVDEMGRAIEQANELAGGTVPTSIVPTSIVPTSVVPAPTSTTPTTAVA